MCLECGCQEGNEKKTDDHDEHSHTHSHDPDGHSHTHSHDHDGHSHTHSHDHFHDHDGHSHTHDHDHSHDHDDHQHETKIVSVEKSVLAHNNEIAEANRTWLKNRNVTTINFISSPGAGKTSLLEATLKKIKNKIKCAIIVGDQRTDNDARRLKDKGAEVRQIETYSSCHLNAEQVHKVLPEVIDDETRLLFIENVGNLVCPAAFDLGEDFKVAILSTPEGEDKPLKYPVIFKDAKAVVISKMDLAPHLDWDLKKCRQYIQQMNPGVYIFELSAKTGEGMDAWIDYLIRIAG